MKPKNPSEESDQPLSDLLGQWKVDATLPPRFQAHVWQRIDQETTKVNRLQSIMNWIEAAFKRPALVTSYVTVLLFIGLTAGYWQAHGRTTSEQTRMRTLYVQSIDPYQVPRH